MMYAKVAKKFFLIAGLSVLTLISLASRLNARPYPDTVGVCYLFRADKLSLKQPCIIGAGYGAGGHYAALQWNDGVKTSIVMVNYCPKRNYDSQGFCKYTVDNFEATRYYRNVFLSQTNIGIEKDITCYRVKKTGNSTCYKLN